MNGVILPVMKEEKVRILGIAPYTGMKTVMEGTEKKGRIVLHYSSPDELQRLWDLLGEEA